MTQEELKKALKSPPIPWLILAGEEEYLKRFYLRKIRELLLPDSGAESFDRIRFEGETIDFDALEEAVKSPPLFAEYKLIEWHLCEFEKMKAADLARLEDFCATRQAYPAVTVVFYAERDKLLYPAYPKKPPARYEKLSKIIECVWVPLSNERQLLGWIDRHFRRAGVVCPAESGRALLARSGRNMDILSGEIDKLIAYLAAAGRSTLTTADVTAVASPTFEADTFGLSNAILSGDAVAAYENLRDMKNRRMDPSLIFGSVFRVFSDLLTVALLREEGLAPAAIRAATGFHEYKVNLYLRSLSRRSVASLEALLGKCRRLDLAAKSGSTDYGALERLIAEASVI